MNCGVTDSVIVNTESRLENLWIGNDVYVGFS